MLIHPMVERLRTLGLTAMADAFIELQNAPDAGELSREDWLCRATDKTGPSYCLTGGCYRDLPCRPAGRPGKSIKPWALSF